MSALPPEWAIERAHAALMKYEDDALQSIVSLREAKQSIRVYPGIRVLAEYIAEHEEAPVDPLLIEARRLVSETVRKGASQEYFFYLFDGHYDDSEEVQSFLTALKRGIELAQEKPA